MVAAQTNLDFAALNTEYSQKSPREILKFALENFDNLAISFSGAEDVVLVDMASKITNNFRVFTLDTGKPSGAGDTRPRAFGLIKFWDVISLLC